MIEYGELEKGKDYLISVGTNQGQNGTFTLCLSGGSASSQLCENIYCSSDGSVGIRTPLVPSGYRMSVKGKSLWKVLKLNWNLNGVTLYLRWAIT
jgi:hypothetical protein